MKTIVILTMMFLSLHIYAQNEQLKSEKIITYDLVANKEVISGENNQVLGNENFLFTSEIKSINYSRLYKIENIKISKLIFNSVTGKNEIIKIDLLSSTSFAWEPIALGIFYFLFMLFWSYFVKNNENRSIFLVVFLLLVSILTLFWLIYFSTTENIALKFLIISILVSSAFSLFCMLISLGDNAEKIGRNSFLGVSLILLTMIFLFYFPEANMFYCFGAMGISLGFIPRCFEKDF